MGPLPNKTYVLPYPTPNLGNTSCPCSTCRASCDKAGGNVKIVIEENPINPIAGFNTPLVVTIMVITFVVALALTAYRSYYSSQLRK